MIPVLRGANIPRQQKANNFVPGSFDYESDVDAYFTYADVAGSIPTLGASGATDVTIAYNTTDPLSGFASLGIVKPSGDRQGASIASNFRIGLGDQGGVLRLSFKYAIFSGAFPVGTSSTDSNLTAYIYDVTNARLIPLSDHKLYSNSAVSATFNGLFQASLDSTEYRLILFIGTADASAWSMKVDDLVVTSIQSVATSIVTDGQAFPSVASGTLITGTTTSPTYGTVAHNVAYWRRVGDSMEIVWDYRQTSAGTAGSGTYLFNLPPGYSIDISKLASHTSAPFQSGVGVFFATRSNNIAANGSVRVYSSTQLVVYEAVVQTSSSSAVETWAGTGSALAFDADASMSFNLRASVPIVGWGSSIQAALTGDDGRVVAAAYWQSSNANADTSTPIAFQSKDFDTHGIVSTSPFRITAAVSGFYSVEGYVILTSGTNTYILIYKNGSAYKTIGWIEGGGVGTFSGQIELKAGDYIDLRPSGPVTVGGNATQSNTSASSISIRKLAGNAVALGFNPNFGRWRAWALVSPNGSFGTMTSINARSRRVSENLEFEITFTSGSTAAVEARLTLGYEGVSGNVTSANDYPTLQLVGSGANSTLGLGNITVMIEASKGYIVLGQDVNGVAAGLVKKNDNTIGASGNVISIRGSVRIAGW